MAVDTTEMQAGGALPPAASAFTARSTTPTKTRCFRRPESQSSRT